MKVLLTVICTLFAVQGMAGFFGGNKMASAATIQDAKANPSRYTWDDGGNISFGNGIYTRRFDFNGNAQVCHSNNYLYGGVTKKCVKPIKDDKQVVGCKLYKNVQLKTQMVGTAQVCTNKGALDDGPCEKYSTVKFNKGPIVKVALFRGRYVTKNSDNAQSKFKGYVNLRIPACND